MSDSPLLTKGPWPFWGGRFPSRLGGALAHHWSRWKHGWRRHLQPGDGRWLDGMTVYGRGRLDLAPLVGVQRSIEMYLPAGLADHEPAPLLVLLHGCRQTPRELAIGAGFPALADRNGFRIVGLAQRGDANPYGCWNWFDPATQRGEGEVALVLSVLADVARLWPTLPGRIWLAGMSAGASLGALLAFHYSHRFNAALLVAGVPVGGARSPATARRLMRQGLTGYASIAGSVAGLRVPPPPLLIVSGTADTVVNPQCARELVDQVVHLHGGQDEVKRVTAAEPPASGFGGRRVEVWRRGRLAVRHLELDELGHVWTGSAEPLPHFETRGPNLANLGIQFFYRSGTY